MHEYNDYQAVLILCIYTYTNYINKNNLKIMNLKREVGINHCHKKKGNKVEIMHLPSLPNLPNG